MRSIGLLLLLSVAAFGQRSGAVRGGANTNSYARPNSFGSVSGFGNVVFPGTGHAPVNTSITNPGFAGRLGATVAGVPVVNGGHGRGRGLGTGQVVYVPYPVGVPAYQDYSGEQGYGYQPQGYQQQMPQPPQVIINQNFISETARPVVREYTQDPSGGIHVYEPPAMNSSVAPEPAQEKPMYLIAFKDHTIYATVAYWVEGETLHYVTGQNVHNQVSLDLLDRELTDRLNHERNVDFRLPPARK
jgi:hypothetical protein